jgi:phage FluMu protein Com
MSIEFRCTHCGRLLRTPEGTSGRQAKCPQCGALSTIPETSQLQDVAPRETVAPPAAAGAEANPYSSPAVDEVRAPSVPLARGFQPTRIDLGDVLSRAWQLYKSSLWKCVGATFFVFVLTYCMLIAVGFAANEAPFWVRQSVSLLVNIGSFWLSLGSFIFFLKVARGEQAAFADLFSGGPWLLRGVGVAILWGLMAIIGLLLLIIPYFIVLVMFAPALLILIDQNTGVIDSLRMAQRATSGNKLTLFALFLVVFFVGGLFTLVTCGIGLFFVQAFGSLVYVVSYLAMTGQRTSVDPEQPIAAAV